MNVLKVKPQVINQSIPITYFGLVVDNTPFMYADADCVVTTGDGQDYICDRNSDGSWQFPEEVVHKLSNGIGNYSSVLFTGTPNPNSLESVILNLYGNEYEFVTINWIPLDL